MLWALRIIEMAKARLYEYQNIELDEIKLQVAKSLLNIMHNVETGPESNSNN